jgi:hypothetical protein
MEARDRLRFLSMEMELQRAWLAAYLDDREARAERRRNSMLWRTLMSVVQARSVWMAAFGLAAEWWRQSRRRTA